MSIAARVRRLANALYRSGFDGEGHWPAIFLQVAAHHLAFQLREVRQETAGQLQMDLFIATNQHKNGLHVDSVVARWIPHFTIAGAVINGVDTVELQSRMDKVNWKDDHRQDIQAFYAERFNNDNAVLRIMQDLTKLGEGSEQNALIRDQFMYRYLQGTGIEWFIDCHRLHRQFECRVTYTQEQGIPSPSQISLELQDKFNRRNSNIVARRRKNASTQVKQRRT